VLTFCPAWQERGVETLTGRTSFVSDDDSLVLEDESARMALRGQGINAGELVTGIVAAVRGVSAANGEFMVKVCRIVIAPAGP
jgi:DNA polymerase delta subunit 2